MVWSGATQSVHWLRVLQSLASRPTSFNTSNSAARQTWNWGKMHSLGLRVSWAYCWLDGGSSSLDSQATSVYPCIRSWKVRVCRFHSSRIEFDHLGACMIQNGFLTSGSSFLGKSYLSKRLCQELILPCIRIVRYSPQVLTSTSRTFFGGGTRPGSLGFVSWRCCMPPFVQPPLPVADSGEIPCPQFALCVDERCARCESRAGAVRFAFIVVWCRKTVLVQEGTRASDAWDAYHATMDAMRRTACLRPWWLRRAAASASRTWSPCTSPPLRAGWSPARSCTLPFGVFCPFLVADEAAKTRAAQACRVDTEVIWSQAPQVINSARERMRRPAPSVTVMGERFVTHAAAAVASG